MRDAEGNEIVTSVQFKNYVNKLRTKTNTYKKKRAELQDLRSEIGVLARTEEILKAQWEQTKKLAVSDSVLNHYWCSKHASFQKNMGDASLSIDASDDESSAPKANARPTTARLAGKDPSEIASLVRQMTNRLEARKKAVAPMLQELRPLREQYQVSDLLLPRNES